MKYQQITLDWSGMVLATWSYLALAGAVWIFLRLIQACFWLPRHLKKQNDVQQMLQEKVDNYEKYIMECEEKEKAMVFEDSIEETDENVAERTQKWKERRECLEMLKRELKRVRDGGDINDWDYLLEEEDEEEKKDKTEDASTAEISENESPKEKCSVDLDKDENVCLTEDIESDTDEKKNK